MTGERPELVEAFLQPPRLKIVVLPSGCASARFRVVRDRLELSDSPLSKHVSGLKKEGLVAVRKSMAGDMPQTSLSLAWRGRKAFVGQVAALRQTADDVVWPQEAGVPE